MRSRFFVFLSIFAAAPTMAVAHAQSAGGPPPQVLVATAVNELIAPMTEATGTVVSNNDSRLAAEVEGRLEWIASVGDIVQVDQPVARIDDRIHAVKFRQMDAMVKRLAADLVFREQEVERFTTLAASDHTSQARLQEVIARRDMTIQELENAKASLDRASGDVDRTVLRAPFRGILAERIGKVGEYMSVGEEVARFVDIDNIEVSLPAAIAIAPILTKGLEIEVAGSSKTLKLPVRAVVKIGDRVSRQVEVRLSANADDWVVGQGVTARLPIKIPENLVSVPRDAVQRRDSAVYFIRIKQDDTAEIVPADIVTIVGNRVAVRSGLAAGDRVVIRGGERLRPGMRVVATGG